MHYNGDTLLYCIKFGRVTPNSMLRLFGVVLCSCSSICFGRDNLLSLALAAPLATSSVSPAGRDPCLIWWGELQFLCQVRATPRPAIYGVEVGKRDESPNWESFGLSTSQRNWGAGTSILLDEYYGKVLNEPARSHSSPQVGLIVLLFPRSQTRLSRSTQSAIREGRDIALPNCPSDSAKEQIVTSKIAHFAELKRPTPWRAAGSTGGR